MNSLKIKSRLEEVKSILKEASVRYPKAEICIAGGFVRDWLLGKPIKDIDVFVTGNIQEKVAWEFSSVYFSCSRIKTYLDTSYGNSNMREDILKLEKYYQTERYSEVDLLVTERESIEDLILNSFDTSICQCAIYLDKDTSRLELVASSYFLWGFKNKAIYKDKRHPIRVDREMRLRKKFPEFAWDSPEGLPPNKLILDKNQLGDETIEGMFKGRYREDPGLLLWCLQVEYGKQLRKEELEEDT